MAIYLIRHAHAGSRDDWHGDDDLRPLTDKGRRQAAWLAGLLDGEPIGHLASSPSARCVETVAPLAEALGLPVEVTNLLAEGADADAAIDRLLEQADHNPAACSHGDVIPKIIRRLKAAGMRTEHSSESSKGSVWVLDVVDGAVVSGSYHPPA